MLRAHRSVLIGGGDISDGSLVGLAVSNADLCSSDHVSSTPVISEETEPTRSTVLKPPTSNFVMETIMNLESIVGLAGEVFCAEGQVAFMIPPTGIPESIRFDVVGAHGDGGTTEQPVPGMPAWAYIQVGNKFVRMNPEIVQFPFHRLADCLWYAVKSGIALPPQRKVSTRCPFRLRLIQKAKTSPSSELVWETGRR